MVLSQTPDKKLKGIFMEMQMKLEHKISFRWLILFALPTIFSSVFANLYTTVDGIFVARFVDTNALSAINITMPMVYLASALGMMFGTGGFYIQYGAVCVGFSFS